MTRFAPGYSGPDPMLDPNRMRLPQQFTYRPPPGFLQEMQQRGGGRPLPRGYIDQRTFGNQSDHRMVDPRYGGAGPSWGFGGRGLDPRVMASFMQRK